MQICNEARVKFIWWRKKARSTERKDKRSCWIVYMWDIDKKEQFITKNVYSTILFFNSVWSQLRQSYRQRTDFENCYWISIFRNFIPFGSANEIYLQHLWGRRGRGRGWKSYPKLNCDAGFDTKLTDWQISVHSTLSDTLPGESWFLNHINNIVSNYSNNFFICLIKKLDDDLMTFTSLRNFITGL